jgi:hypothetical protein
MASNPITTIAIIPPTYLTLLRYAPHCPAFRPCGVAQTVEAATLRRECLDHILITGPRHLDAVLREFAQHYNAHRPHRSLHQRPPAGATPPLSAATIRPLRRNRLGGLIHEYVQVA